MKTNENGARPCARWSALGALTLAAAVTCGCGSSGGGGTSAGFSGAPVQTVVSASGTLHVAARTSPNPVTRGETSLELTVLDDKQAPVDGVTIKAVPWMPTMGHGTSTQPEVLPKGNGVYELTNVNLFMPGHWEVRLTLSGPVNDTSTLAFDIP